MMRLEASEGGLVKISGLAVKGPDGRLQRARAPSHRDPWLALPNHLTEVKQLSEQKEQVAALSGPGDIDVKVPMRNIHQCGSRFPNSLPGTPLPLCSYGPKVWTRRRELYVIFDRFLVL